MSKEAEKKCPEIGYVLLLFFIVISFIYCPEWKASLDRAILPYVKLWPLKALVKTAIMMAYVVPLFIGGVLIQIKNSFIQIIGMLFLGLSMGIILRICLAFVGVLYPY